MDAKERAELAALLKNGTAAASALQQELRGEREALIAHDIEQLESCVARKKVSVAELNEFEASIRTVLDRNSRNQGIPATDSWLEQARLICPGYPELEEAILLLGDTLAGCYKQSIENEGLVNLGLARVSKALKMLDGGDSTSGLYKPDSGITASMPGRRSLARV